MPDDETAQHSAYFAAVPTTHTASPAFPVSPPRQVGPQEYATAAFRPPAPRRGRPAWMTVAGALAVGLALAAGVAAVASRGSGLVPAAGPVAADAERECRSAIELEAQGRVQSVNAKDTGVAVATVAGVDIATAVKKGAGWTVDGTMRFNLLSFLGNLPATVYVTCDATVSGRDLTTTLHSR